MNKYFYEFKMKALQHILLPIIFLTFLYITYGVVIQGFLSVELQNFFNISSKFLSLLNIPVFAGMCLGIYISTHKIKYKKSTYFLLIVSVLINIFIFFSKNIFYFSIIRFITGIGFGYLFGYINFYYHYYKSKHNITSFALESGRTSGIISAAFFSYYFVQILGWKFAFFSLINGVFIIISINFLPNIRHNKHISLDNFSIKKKALSILFMTIYLIIGSSYYIFIINIKYILMTIFKDISISNLYLILFSGFFVFSFIVSAFLYNKFDMRNTLFTLIFLLMFISFLSLFTFFKNQLIFFILLNITIQNIIWNATILYSVSFFNVNEYYFIIKHMFFMISIGGILASIFSFLLHKNLIYNIFSFTIFSYFIFLIIIFILPKNYNRHNHFMK
ncbi:hypothetical protein X274_07600 [Marinitoga sp. 1155]|nr:hypothetical protein X274_07600 [Marinitoga sp. 1155]NUV00356.1 hypothetical protein [Marinitoga sp. 1154]